MLIAIIPAKAMAGMPDISAGKKDFDMFRGLYILTDKVRVSDNVGTITADKAVVKLTEQKVWANGDVTLEYEGLEFRSDKIFVRGVDKTVEAISGLKFTKTSGLHITADFGTFNWKSKEVDFYGRVKVKGVNKIKNNVEYSHVRYNVVENKILLLEKNKSNTTNNYKLTETDPTE